MLAVVAAIVFAIALLFDLADVTSDAFDYQTLITLGLLLLALHMAGFGTSTNWRRSFAKTRTRTRRRR
ncbi:hypothetical protein J4573_22195 [Actinomadura barringtoniae]|uniref:Uncharacterized protein n=1 Tax=Actinomadura barringtoniae TaxID=1427535 RepID=A0A939T5R1_9ACTN|nr:hypothetical protein [Actinomadura barringtoniae]MBO2449829.1 hypothetical protein [Actinomadura barringtoniae]